VNRQEAIREFKETILPLLKELYEEDGEVDWIARRQGWNDWTDMLCKDGIITEAQYDRWDNPF